jgi:energy-coupling factor transport system substrate-specific component
MSWIAASMAILGVALVAGFAWYERAHPSARVLALVATLAALAALGRIAFAPLPNVKPTTDIVLLTGYALGGAPGFAVGAVAALASNLFFGQGPWTPWQMVAWAGVGAGGALLARLARRELGRFTLAAACGVAGLAYGGVMNLSLWVIWSGDHSLVKLKAVFVTSLPFDAVHAIGNVAFCLAFGPALVHALQRFRSRFEVTWHPVGATAGAAVALAALLVALPAPARADVPAATVRYLERAQNADGGFGASPGASSTQMHTGWAALGLAAAGRNPRDVRRGGRDAISYIRAHASALRGDLGERSRTILALRAAGVAPRAGGRNLLRELLAARRRDGSFAGRVNTTAFAVLALRAAGRSASDRVVRAAARWIAGQANADGGFNFGGRGGPSGADDTGAALQALAAAGMRRTPVVRRGAAWLGRHQNPDGGFSLLGGTSNAQSTAWAVQGLIAAGRDPARVRRDGSRSPLAYLRSLVMPGGAVRYSRTSAQTPVWVTAQAMVALAGRAFPIAPVPRAPRAAAPRRAKRAPAPERATRASAPERTAPGRRTPRAAAPERTAPRSPAPAPSPRPAPERAAAAPTPLEAGVARVLAPATQPAGARRAGVLAGVLVRLW